MDNAALTDVGVVVGRFQSAHLHDGHMAVLNRARKHAQVIVVVGSPPARATMRNPLSFQVRRQMINFEIPEAIVLPLQDMRDDASWSQALDRLIRAAVGLDTVTLYAGRDSFQSHYSGSFPVVTVEEIPQVSATSYREVNRRLIVNSRDFRAGMIHSVARETQRLDLAVDMAVFYEDKLLLAQKPGENKWRFPGGMFDPDKDASFVTAASREFYEETGVSVEHATWKYVGDFRVPDWRIQSPEHFFHTVFFHATLPWMSHPKPMDDLAGGKAEFVRTSTLGEHSFVPEHLALFCALKPYI